MYKVENFRIYSSIFVYRVLIIYFLAIFLQIVVIKIRREYIIPKKKKQLIIKLQRENVQSIINLFQIYKNIFLISLQK